MTRKRYVQHPETLELVPEEEFFCARIVLYSAKNNPLAGDRHYDGLRATDGADISTRSKHREYMRAKNLTTIDDFTETWKKAEKEREKLFTGAPSSERKEDIARAFRQLESRRK